MEPKQAGRRHVRQRREVSSAVDPWSSIRAGGMCPGRGWFSLCWAVTTVFRSSGVGFGSPGPAAAAARRRARRGMRVISSPAAAAWFASLVSRDLRAASVAFWVPRDRLRSAERAALGPGAVDQICLSEAQLQRRHRGTDDEMLIALGSAHASFGSRCQARAETVCALSAALCSHRGHRDPCQRRARFEPRLLEPRRSTTARFPSSREPRAAISVPSPRDSRDPQHSSNFCKSRRRP